MWDTMKPSLEREESVIIEIAGEEVLELVGFLKLNPNISEFILAEKLGKEINPVRNLLYKLLDANLVSFTRKKDKQKGWYIYYWTYNNNNISHLFWDLKLKRIDKLQERLVRERNTVFFICPNGCIRIDFDKAFEFDYRCPECGELIVQQDNSIKVAEFETEIAQLTEELKVKETEKATLIKRVEPTKEQKAAKKVAAKKKAAQKVADTESAEEKTSKTTKTAKKTTSKKITTANAAKSPKKTATKKVVVKSKKK